MDHLWQGGWPCFKVLSHRLILLSWYENIIYVATLVCKCLRKMDWNIQLYGQVSGILPFYQFVSHLFEILLVSYLKLLHQFTYSKLKNISSFISGKNHQFFFFSYSILVFFWFCLANVILPSLFFFFLTIILFTLENGFI